MSAPIGNTCPDIDEVIAKVEAAGQVLKDINREADLPEHLDASMEERELAEVPAMMEDLRRANSELREYGEEQEKEAVNNSELLEETRQELEETQEMNTKLAEELANAESMAADHLAEVRALNDYSEKLKARIAELEGAEPSILRKLIIK